MEYFLEFPISKVAGKVVPANWVLWRWCPAVIVAFKLDVFEKAPPLVIGFYLLKIESYL